MAYSVTAVADPANGRMVLTVTWDGVLLPTVSRFDPDGTWRFVRRAAPADVVDGEWTGSDFEAPADVPFHYAARDSDEELHLSPVYVLLSNATAWLRHPQLSAYNVRLRLTEMPDLRRPAVQGVFAVLGRYAPVALTMPRLAAIGDLRFFTETSPERFAIERIFADGAVLQLSVPGGNGFGTQYIAPGELIQTRVTTYGAEAARVWEVPFSVVDRPA